MDWLVSIPAWGPRCVPLLLEAALPSMAIAAKQAGGHVRLLIHTDEPTRVAAALSGFEAEIRPVPAGKSAHHSFGAAHREAIAAGADGEALALVNADMVWSVECFAAAERRFAEGKRLIVTASNRTLGGDPPIGATSRELLAWTMRHRHPSVVENFWGSGRSGVPWVVLFEQGSDIVMHGFHLHPWAVIKDARAKFSGVTVDRDIVENFPRDEIHIITSADESAFAEISPPERTFTLLNRPMTTASIAEWASRQASEQHRWMFEQRITLVGDGRDLGDEVVCEEVLLRLRGGPRAAA